MINPEVSIGTQYINGFSINVESAKAQHTKLPGDTALHEATHAVAAIRNGTSVKKATIEPGPGYLGLTELSKPDPIAAAAPHADGCSGTSHDVHIIALMGHDVASASKAAASITANNREEISEVASVLEEKKTISGFDIETAMSEVHEKKTRGEKVTITIKGPDGEEQQRELYAQKQSIILPGEWVTLKPHTT